MEKEKKIKKLETISLQENHWSPKQVQRRGQKKPCREGLPTQADKHRVAFPPALLSPDRPGKCKQLKVLWECGIVETELK